MRRKFVSKWKIINNEKDQKLNVHRPESPASIHPPPPAPPTTLAARPLRQNLPQSWVASINARMVYPHMALQIVGSRIPVFAVAGAERADVAGRFVHETVADHLVFALETLAADAARAIGDGTVVRSGLGVDVCVRAVSC